MSASAPLPATTFDLCVIGAGVSGLCLARLAAGRGLRVLVLEMHPEAGGCLCSVPVGGPEPQGWLELGAHTCYNSYVRFLEVMAGTDFESRATSRKGLGFRMVEGGAMRSIPSCLNFLEAAACLPRIFSTRKAGQSAAAYYSRILGRRNWDRVLHPAFNAVASQDTAGFPADALFKQRPRRRKDVLRSFAVHGGLGPAVQALGEQPGIHLALSGKLWTCGAPGRATSWAPGGARRSPPANWRWRPRPTPPPACWRRPSRRWRPCWTASPPAR